MYQRCASHACSSGCGLNSISTCCPTGRVEEIAGLVLAFNSMADHEQCTMWGQNPTGKGKARAEKSDNESDRPHVGRVHAGISQLSHTQCDIPSRRAGANPAGRGSPTSRGSTIQCGAARRAACVHRALSRRVADPGPDGFDIPARSGGSFALVGRPRAQVAVGRRLGKGPGGRTVGSQREVAGADPCGIGDFEQQSDLAAATRICLREPAG